MTKGTLEIHSKKFNFTTGDQEIELVDLTRELRDFVQRSELTEGRLTVFVPGSTGAIIATEFEPRLNKDTVRMIKQLIPKGAGYNHDKIDNNAHSHLRTTFLGSEMTIPIIDGELTLGMWQQIVFADMDVRPRNRTVIFQILGIGK